MTNEHKEALTILFSKGCTDNDIMDFCEAHKIPYKEAFHLFAEYKAPKVCEGCKHVDYYNSMYPCNSCSRPLKDLYEKETT